MDIIISKKSATDVLKAAHAFHLSFPFFCFFFVGSFFRRGPNKILPSACIPSPPDMAHLPGEEELCCPSVTALRTD